MLGTSEKRSGVIAQRMRERYVRLFFPLEAHANAILQVFRGLKSSTRTHGLMSMLSL